MSRLIRNAVSMLLVMTAITGLVYPLAATGVAQVLFSHQANGSLIERDGKPIGSELIGQYFDDPKYFWGRPSATSPQPNTPSHRTVRTSDRPTLPCGMPPNSASMRCARPIPATPRRYRQIW